MKKVLILGAGEMQVPVIQKAKLLNVFSIVADLDIHAPGLVYADKKVGISTLDYPALLALARNEKVNGVLTTSDYPVNIVARISQELGLRSMSINVAEICTNKHLQRKILQENGVKTPFFKLCEKLEDLSALTSFPYVVKPIDSSASRGVQKVNDVETLKKAFQQACTYSKSKKVLIESFIEGREFSVETYTQQGVTTIVEITEKLLIGEEHGSFVEDTHIESARLSAYERDLINKEVLNAIQTIGLDNCPSHTEVKLNCNGVFIIEMACRLGGDYITSDLVPLSTGVDMLGNLIKISLGEEIDVTHKWNKVACVQFMNSVNYYRCIDFIRSGHSAIVRHEEKIFSDAPIKNSLDRLGYLILQTDTMEELEKILEKIK